MKNQTFLLLTTLHLVSLLPAQRVLERCSDNKCDAGLFCVTLQNSEKFCATCDQSKLNDLTSRVSDRCKNFPPGGGFYPNNNPYYQSARAYDGRVAVTVYDEIMEDCKRCREIREERDKVCWNGGNPGHIQQHIDMRTITTNIGSWKEQSIKDKMVFYCSKSSYEGYLRDYDNKCKALNTSNIESTLSNLEREISNGKQVDCSELARYTRDCEECYNVAYNFIRYAFNDRSDNIPFDVHKRYKDAEALKDLSKRLADRARSNSLCK